MVHQEQITFDTTGHRQMDDLTDKVAAIVERSGITTGIVQVCCVGSTAAVGTIEFEPGLERDLPEMLDRLIPPSRDYGHERAWHDGNGTRTCRPRCSDRRSRCPWLRESRYWAHGSRFVILSVMFDHAAARWW